MAITERLSGRRLQFKIDAPPTVRAVVWTMLAALPWPAACGSVVTGYELNTGIGFPLTGDTLIVLRTCQIDERPFFLAVDPRSLLTSLEPQDAVTFTPAPWDSLRVAFGATPYIRAIEETERNDTSRQDAGLTHFPALKNGTDLTIDLCPSKRPLDRSLFVKIFDGFGEEEKPVPIAVSVSGLWVTAHKQDLGWLLNQEKQGRIAITWVNHSYNYKVGKGLPLTRSFLLEEGTDLRYEVLQTEVCMIQNGMLPSVFFRFPGLVSSTKLVTGVTAFGLIPVGTDCWLAKKQWPKEGSIVLIHGNGNEPLGVKMFLQLMQKDRDLIVHKQWQLYDLRESVTEEESGNTQRDTLPGHDQ
jgi:hypothetical protein